MNEPLGVTPAELRAASRYLADVSSRMKERAVGAAGNARR